MPSTDTQGVKTWDIFLSHNSADKEWVTDLAEQLESEPMEDREDSPTIKVFLDIWDIEAGENIVTKLNEGLEKSRFIALIMSPEFFRSNWTAVEWTHCVAEDPRNTKGRIIPILHRDVSLNGNEGISYPAPFRALRYLDFRTAKRKDVYYRELLSRIRGLPRGRGRRRSPTPATFPQEESSRIAPSLQRGKSDEVPEILISNLLPVTSTPKTIWSGGTSLRKPKEVYEKVSTGDGVIIHSNRLYTFGRLSDELNPLTKVIDGRSVSDHDSRDAWMADQDKSRLYTWLLNSYLRKHLEDAGLDQDEKGRYFFPPSAEETVVRRGNREVTARKVGSKEGEYFWVHLAAEIRFYRIWDSYFLKTVPCFFFTSDGREPLDGKAMGKMSIQWGGRQRNANILRDIIFWSEILKGQDERISIAAGPEAITVEPIPTIARMNHGIRTDHIRFSKLMQFARNELDRVASEMEVSERDEEDDDE